MVSDTEPRYRLVDSNGNVVGSLYAEADGTLKLQEGTSGSDNEVSVSTDGTFTAPAVSTDAIDITPVDSGVVTVSSDSEVVIPYQIAEDQLTELLISFDADPAGGSAIHDMSRILRWDGAETYANWVVKQSGGSLADIRYKIVEL